MSNRTLFYVADPMCSWCWGFVPVLEEVRKGIPPGMLRLVLGGLAADSDKPMDEATRRYIQSAWEAVEAKTGARFNREFWTRCKPRRSTWPSCRAVLAAQHLRPSDGADTMFRAIQHAYYLEARNPSDRATLLDLAEEVGLDREAFDAQLDGPENQMRLVEHFEIRDRLGVRGFPTLVLEDDTGSRVVAHGHARAEEILAAIAS